MPISKRTPRYAKSTASVPARGMDLLKRYANSQSQVVEAVVLSDKDLQDYKEAFAAYDKNNDGKINSKELLQLLRCLGENPSEDQLLNLMLEMGTNGNFSFLDFIELMESRVNNFFNDQLMMEAFSVFDSNQDGKISADELRETMDKMENSFTEDELREFMNIADINRDGIIDFEEFKKMMFKVEG